MQIAKCGRATDWRAHHVARLYQACCGQTTVCWIDQMDGQSRDESQWAVTISYLEDASDHATALVDLLHGLRHEAGARGFEMSDERFLEDFLALGIISSRRGRSCFLLSFLADLSMMPEDVEAVDAARIGAFAATAELPVVEVADVFEVLGRFEAEAEATDFPLSLTALATWAEDSGFPSKRSDEDFTMFCGATGSWDAQLKRCAGPQLLRFANEKLRLQALICPTIRAVAGVLEMVASALP